MEKPFDMITTRKGLSLQAFYATQPELESIMAIIEQAKCRLRQMGIDQWQDGYPNEDAIRTDLAKRQGFVFKANNRPVAYAALVFGDEPTYQHIDGQWLDTRPYVVVHRIAVHDEFGHQGVASAIFKFTEDIAKARQVSSFRIDTHQDNLYMQHLIARCGFTYCGIIQVRDGARKAYEKRLK